MKQNIKTLKKTTKTDNERARIQYENLIKSLRHMHDQIYLDSIHSKNLSSEPI